MLYGGIKDIIAVFIGLKRKGLDMEKLDSFESEMQSEMTELDETRDIRDLLKEQVTEIESKLDEILDNLNDLEGDAAESVKQELLEEKEKKTSEISEKERSIESTEQELNEKFQQLEESLSERHEAMSKVQELGRTADIDVSDSVNDINDEINRLEEDKQKILESIAKGN